jgi:hypothetical protein
LPPSTTTASTHFHCHHSTMAHRCAHGLCAVRDRLDIGYLDCYIDHGSSMTSLTTTPPRSRSATSTSAQIKGYHIAWGLIGFFSSPRICDASTVIIWLQGMLACQLLLQSHRL